MTNLDVLVGKKLSMEVCEGVDLTIKLLSETSVEYQFIGTEDGTLDAPVVTELEVVIDDIEDVEDYSFSTPLGSRYFLHQFEEMDKDQNPSLMN